MFYPSDIFYLYRHQDFIDAMRAKLWLLGADVQFVSGHGPMSKFAKERQTNPCVRDGA